jgi:hypothetical protein
MNDSQSTIPATGPAVDSTTVRDCQYLTYGNISGSSGHRLVYHNDSTADQNFLAYNPSSIENDFMGLIVLGGAPSVNVL